MADLSAVEPTSNIKHSNADGVMQGNSSILARKITLKRKGTKSSAEPVTTPNSPHKD